MLYEKAKFLSPVEWCFFHIAVWKVQAVAPYQPCFYSGFTWMVCTASWQTHVSLYLYPTFFDMVVIWWVCFCLLFSPLLITSQGLWWGGGDIVKKCFSSDHKIINAHYKGIKKVYKKTKREMKESLFYFESNAKGKGACYQSITNICFTNC